jgi:protein-S-isoprenylcysteine O-methyltransferase Ste14
MLERILSIAHHATWLFFVGYWIWSARGIKAPVRTQSPWLRLFAYWLPLALAVVLLGPGAWFGDSVLQERFVPKHVAVKAVGLALTVAGIAFACWARHLLGRNWSSEVQIKQDHQLIQASPYRRVRHPIYTGLLLAFLGTALKVGDWRGLLAVAIVAASFWFKLRQEERWLLERFGAPYADYMRRTRALLPGVL